MEEKKTEKNIILSQKQVIGNKKRSIFVINSSQSEVVSKSPKPKNVIIKKSRRCSGCSRKRKTRRG